MADGCGVQGKTLALLVSALSWQQTMKRQQGHDRSVRIYFCSRTHSQLRQVVGMIPLHHALVYSLIVRYLIRIGCA